MLAKHFCNGEHQIGCSSAFAQLAGELNADHLRNDHRDRLSEHCRFGFNAAHAPTQNAETIDHRSVRIGADKSVGISCAMAVRLVNKNYAGEILEVNLVDDSGIGRNNC